MTALYVKATPEQKALGAAYLRPSDGVLIDRNGYPIRVGIPATAGTTKPSPLTNKWTPWGFHHDDAHASKKRFYDWLDEHKSGLLDRLRQIAEARRK